jgi:RNA polymerase sigma-70 factor (ECF subfamily)
MSDNPRLARFDAAVLAHLDAAYNLARWLIADRGLAEDAVQDACVKALRSFDSCTGPSPKAWFMAVVRNTCLDALRGRRRRAGDDEFDEDLHSAAGDESFPNPEAHAMRASDARWVRVEIARLPLEFREVVVLRELEEMTYKEISAVVKIPIGTVMSRLARGRDMLAERMRAEARRRTV